MMPNSRNLVLSKSQAARLIALRDSKNVKTNIVIQAALDLVKTKVKTRTVELSRPQWRQRSSAKFRG